MVQAFNCFIVSCFDYSKLLTCFVPVFQAAAVPLKYLNAAHEVFLFSCPSMLFHQRLNIFDRKPIRTMLLKFNRNLSHFIYSLRSRDFILVANVPDCHQAYCIFLGCLCHTLCAFGFCIVVMKFLWDAETCCFLGIIKRLLMGGGEGKPLQS